ncbi:MAG: YbaB/EbfC family nucleoid-associated protein [Eubacteriales bacterium]|nr:YbaB/EbfC family nucleoid-associated protein [Eubacteriales bacterium]
MGRGMKAGKAPKKKTAGGSGRKAQMQQLQQLQNMQREMQQMESDLAEKEITASSGGGVISVTVNGKKEIKDLKIDPDVIDPEDPETLQDLVIAAVNEAMRQVDELQENSYSQITGGLGGLNIPGL